MLAYRMNQDLRSRVPIAIGYVLIIASALLMGAQSGMLLMYAFFAFSLHEYVRHEMREEDIPLPRVVPIYLISHAVVIAAALWAPRDYILYMAVCSGIYLLLNTVIMLREIRVLFSSKPIWAHALLYLGLPFATVVGVLRVYPDFHLVLLAIFIMIWINDAGAYFTGRAWGRTKLHERISPSKSREGMFGGGLLTLLIAMVLHRVFGQYELATWMIMAVVVWITAVVGDLAESTWKRNIGIKDSGTVLRGHGGFLDRLDSFIYTAPFIVLLLLVLEVL